MAMAGHGDLCQLLAECSGAHTRSCFTASPEDRQQAASGNLVVQGPPVFHACHVFPLKPGIRSLVRPQYELEAILLQETLHNFGLYLYCGQQEDMTGMHKVAP